MKHTIYGLYDPSIEGPPCIRYVGYTAKDPEKRLASHIHEVVKKGLHSCHRHKWIAAVLRKGSRPAVVVLEEVNEKNWQERERSWISRLRHLNLTNATDGGDGLINPTEDVRRRISAMVSASLMSNQRRKGIPHSEESKAAMRKAAATSKKCGALYAARKGRFTYTPSEETREKIRQSHLGRKSPWSRKAALRMCEQNRGTYWVNNGTNQQRVKIGDSIPVGWTLGLLPFSNESIAKRTESIHKFYAGLSNKKRKAMNRGSTAGLTWINNGTERRCHPKHEPLPEGWSLGVGKRRRRTKAEMNQ